MIVPMKKVSLIIMGDKKTEALKKLRKLGLLHIQIEEGSGQKLIDLNEKVALIESAIYSLNGGKKITPKNITAAKSLKIAEEIQDFTEQKKQYVSQLAALETELERLKSWGEVDPEKITELTQKGVEVLLYDIPKQQYSALGDAVKTVRLGGTKASVKCLVLKTGADGEEEIISSLKPYLFVLPEISSNEVQQSIEKLKKNLADIDEKLISYSCYTDSMKNAVKQLEKEIQFEIYATGMTDESLSENPESRLSVAHFVGYVEAENIEKIKKAAKSNKWGIVVEDPTEEDNVPTKLKNNKFISLVYPLTDFLGTVPGYFEYDISAWFLFFILIFFGIIFGDGGYGLIISAVAAVPIIKSLISKKPIVPAFLLFGLFGLSTVLWGTLTCTWFGLSAELVPAWLRSLSIPVISNVYADKLWTLPWTAEGVGLTTSQNLQIFCFTLALVQLSVAHIKGAVRNRKSLKMLGDVGSILQLIGIYYLVLSLVVNPEVFSFGLVVGGIPVGTVAIALIAVGFITTFIFANYEGSIIKAILSSLANIVSVLLGVVNVFSDIVSYIRLWAVGLAGAAISATVNELAGPLLGNFMFMVFAIILLVFGHGLNMILNVLSVIVHGIRLNTLEFSSHLDMSWSGHKFKPFEE